jgi:CheY-specific phosphatase CheX
MASGKGVQGTFSQPASMLEELTQEALQAVSLVDDLTQNATAALFDTYGVVVHQDGPCASKTLQSAAIISIIGFSSQSLSGSLILALPRAVAQQTLPVPGASLADWSGELANQLLGRVKNQLLRYDVVINMSLPVVLSGGVIQLLATAHQITRYYSFSSRLGKVLIRLDMEMSDNLRLTQSEDADRIDAIVNEGELVLF